MHEVAISRSILELALKKLEHAADAIAVLEIRIAVGEFRNVDPESLQFAFENLRMENAATRGCNLIIEAVQAQALCRGAEHAYHPHFERGFCCPVCHGGMGKLTRGEELDLISVTFETALNKENCQYARIS